MKSASEKWPLQPELIQWHEATREYFYCPLDGMLAHPRVTRALKLIGEFPLIHMDSQRNCQSNVLYPGTDITIHRLVRQWGNALHFVGMKCFSRHTFVAPPRPHRLDILLCIYVS